MHLKEISPSPIRDFAKYTHSNIACFTVLCNHHSLPSGGNSSDPPLSAEDLNQYLARIVEVIQLGNASEALGVRILGLRVHEAIPPPQDPTGGQRATNDTRQDTSGPRYSHSSKCIESFVRSILCKTKEIFDNCHI